MSSKWKKATSFQISSAETASIEMHYKYKVHVNRAWCLFSVSLFTASYFSTATAVVIRAKWNNIIYFHRSFLKMGTSKIEACGSLYHEWLKRLFASFIWRKRFNPEHERGCMKSDCQLGRNRRYISWFQEANQL